MILSDEETAILQTLVEGDGKMSGYADAKALLKQWREKAWTKASLRRAISGLEEKRLVRRRRHVALTVTEAGVAATKSL